MPSIDIQIIRLIREEQNEFANYKTYLMVNYLNRIAQKKIVTISPILMVHRMEIFPYMLLHPKLQIVRAISLY